MRFLDREPGSSSTPGRAATVDRVSARDTGHSGGPAGGNGGRGGSVIFQVDEGLSTLLDFKYQPRLIAKTVEPGRGKEQYGHGADDIVVRSPARTIALDEESGATLADLVMPGDGGNRAGWRRAAGDMHFASRRGARRESRLRHRGRAAMDSDGAAGWSRRPASWDFRNAAIGRC